MPVVDSNDYHQIIHGLVMADQNRKNLIATDVFREARRGNCCIVISTIKVYCEDLYAMISQYWPKTAIATGDYSDKHNNAQVKKIENGEATVLITTFELLGEGFDVPKLNRAFLALPFRERARVEQMVGRIQRTAPNKDDAIIYDYVDSNIGILNDQYRARKAVYKSLGMTILEDD
jgi:superfamily II DNA or RNA helicase